MTKLFFDRRYSIRIVWLFVIFLIFMFLIVFVFMKWQMHLNGKESIDYTVKVVLAILAFLTLIYHIHNLENQIRTQQNSNRQNLAKYTYDICSDFRKPLMMDINEDLRCLIKEQSENLEKHNIKLFINHIDQDANKTKRQALVVTLNYFESVSAMVLAGDLDNEIVKRLFGKLFGRYYVKLQHYINHRQEEAPRSWVNYEKLALKWINDEKN